MNKINKGLMMLGLFFIGFGIYFIVIALASKTWDQIPGQIISSSIPAGITSAGSATQRRIVYRIEVIYTYEVDGKLYTNSFFSNGSGDTVKGGFNKKAKAREWLKNSDYTTGKKVIVYVNPNDSTDTVLSAGINIGTIMPIILGILFFLTGYLIQKSLIKIPK